MVVRGAGDAAVWLITTQLNPRSNLFSKFNSNPSTSSGNERLSWTLGCSNVQLIPPPNQTWRFFNARARSRCMCVKDRVSSIARSLIILRFHKFGWFDSSRKGKSVPPKSRKWNRFSMASTTFPGSNSFFSPVARWRWWWCRARSGWIYCCFPARNYSNKYCLWLPRHVHLAAPASRLVLNGAGAKGSGHSHPTWLILF